MISILFSLLVVGLIFALVYWVLQILPIPAPIKQIILVICVVLFVLYLISILLPMAGGHPLWR